MEERKDKLNTYLQENWSKMEFTPSDAVWDQLSSSLAEEKFDRNLRSSLDEFDETPSESVFNRLATDLTESQALQSGFDKWEETSAVPGFESLRRDLDNDLFDQSIRKSYQHWNGGNSRDLWEKLDEELSRESVWLRLQQSLNAYRQEPVGWKSLLAVAAMLLLFFRISDESAFVHTSGVYTSSVIKTTEVTTQVSSGSAVISSSKNIPVGENSPVSDKRINNEEVLVSQVNPENEPKTNTSFTGVEEHVIADSSDETANLPDLAIYTANNTLAVRYPEARKRFSRFSIEAGPQLAVLTERSESSLSTFTPGLGFGGNINYRYALGPITISHGIGYSAYNQHAGDYVNGRYRTGNQQMNAVQFNTVAGVGFKKVQFYGGLVLSRVLSGIERSGSTVTKVYHFDPIAPGLIVGINVTLFDFRRSSLGTGIQYSWIRGLNNQENSLSNVQGVRLNLVYNF